MVHQTTVCQCITLLINANNAWRPHVTISSNFSISLVYCYWRAELILVSNFIPDSLIGSVIREERNPLSNLAQARVPFFSFAGCQRVAGGSKIVFIGIVHSKGYHNYDKIASKLDNKNCQNLGDLRDIFLLLWIYPQSTKIANKIILAHSG